VISPYPPWRIAETGARDIAVPLGDIAGPRRQPSGPDEARQDSPVVAGEQGPQQVPQLAGEVRGDVPVVE
jgi:hypothetical protein